MAKKAGARDLARLKKEKRGFKTRLTNLQTRTAALVTYLDANADKFQTKSRPGFDAKVNAVRTLLLRATRH